MDSSWEDRDNCHDPFDSDSQGACEGAIGLVKAPPHLTDYS